jgi:ketosteroid isomerase-like protein
MSTQTSFDLGALSRAIAERDAAAQLACYADDAQVRIVDRNSPPSAPRTLQGKDAIREWIEDICARDMTHAVEQQVASADGAAFAEWCRYPDGTQVLCCTLLEVRDGQITRQVVSQAWDG